MTPEKRTASALVRLLKRSGRHHQRAQKEYEVEARKLFETFHSEVLNWNHPAYPVYARAALPAGSNVKAVRRIKLAQDVFKDGIWYRIIQVKQVEYVLGEEEKTEYWLQSSRHEDGFYMYKEDLRRPWLPRMVEIVRLIDHESWFLQPKEVNGPVHAMIDVAERVKAERKWDEKIQEVFGLKPEQQAAVAKLMRLRDLAVSWNNRIHIVCHHVSSLISGLPREKYPKLFCPREYGTENRQISVRIDGETFFWDRSGHLVWERDSQDVHVPGDERVVYRYEHWYPVTKIDSESKGKKTRREKKLEEEWQNLRKKAKTEDMRELKRRNNRARTERQTIELKEKEMEEALKAETPNDE